MTAARGRGLTLVELLVALVLSGIISTAVVTMAYALSTAEQQGRSFSSEQARLRYTQLRLIELLRNARLICDYNGSDLIIWAADNDAVGQINIGELVVIERSIEKDQLILHELAGSEAIALSDIASLNWSNKTARKIELLPTCKNVEIELFGRDNEPLKTGWAKAWARSAVITFDTHTEGIWRTYRISGKLRGWAGHLLKEQDGQFVIDSQRD